MLLHSKNTSWPIGVKRICLVVLSNSFSSKECSSRVIERLIEDGATPSVLAVFEKLPDSTAFTNTAISASSESSLFVSTAQLSFAFQLYCC